MLDPATLEPPPRTVRLKESYATERSGAVVLLAMLLIGATGMAWSYAEGQRHLIERGVEERGTVLWERYYSGRSTGYLMEVRYPSPSGTATKRFEISPVRYGGEREGDAVTVKMDPQEPSNAALYGLSDGAARDHIRYAYLGLGVGFGLVLLGFLLDGLALRRQRRILRTWLPGVLTVERMTPHVHQNVQTLVSGTLVDDRGRLRRARRVPCETIPPVGTTVPVLYDPDSNGVTSTVTLGKVEAIP